MPGCEYNHKGFLPASQSLLETTDPTSPKRPFSRANPKTFLLRCRRRRRLGSMHFVMVVVLMQLVLLILLPQHSTLAQGQSATCDFGSGLVFSAGESLGALFTSRCGSPEDFPCFCDPSSDPPIDCPFCGIATPGGGLDCVSIGGGVVSILTLSGSPQDCVCLRNPFSGQPESRCGPLGSLPGGTDGLPEDPVCTLDWADGSTTIFQDGESYGALFTTRCGSTTDFPCFCDVSRPDKILCPYCTVPTITGDLACGRVGSFFDLINTAGAAATCVCGNDLEADCVPSELFVFPTGEPTTAPPTTPFPTTLAPTPKPTIKPTAAPNTLPPIPAPTAEPTPSPTTSPTPVPTRLPSMSPTQTPVPTVPLPVIDKPTLLAPSRTPPIATPGPPVCSYFDPATGAERFVPEGFPLPRTLIQGPCDTGDEEEDRFPVLCNPGLPGSVEYPYCVFEPPFSSRGRLGGPGATPVCAATGERVQVPMTVPGEEEEESVFCSCLYPNPAIGPVSSCPDLMKQPLLSLVETIAPTLAPTPRLTTTNQESSDTGGGGGGEASAVRTSFRAAASAALWLVLWMPFCL